MKQRWQKIFIGGAVLSLVILAGYLLHHEQRKAKAARVSCRANLFQICMAMLLYADDHGGRFPNRFADISDKLGGPDVLGRMFVCPSSGKHAGGSLLNVDHWTTYVLCTNRTAEGPRDTVLAFCPPENHGGKVAVVAFTSGEVKWCAVKGTDLHGLNGAVKWCTVEEFARLTNSMYE